MPDVGGRGGGPSRPACPGGKPFPPWPGGYSDVGLKPTTAEFEDSSHEDDDDPVQFCGVPISSEKLHYIQ